MSIKEMLKDSSSNAPAIEEMKVQKTSQGISAHEHPAFQFYRRLSSNR